jgi:outer membrane protein assembly factor BamB
VPQVVFPGGDGWLYSFDPQGTPDGKGKLLWKFDCNPKDSKWVLGGRGTRNNLLNAPTVSKGLVYIAVGQDPEHGDGIGHVWCIDPTRRGDVSPELVFNSADPQKPIPHRRTQACDEQQGDFTKPNPNSALVWHYEGTDLDGDGEVEFEETMHRSLSRVAIKNNLVIVSDTTGIVHCIDAKTGRAYWTYDLLASCWSTPLISAQHVYVTDEDGDVAVFRLSADPNVAMPGGNPISVTTVSDSAYASPCSANNVLYILTKQTLHAIADPRRLQARSAIQARSASK